ncbi:hypothetical protein TrST_g12459 [Triparma strigata]|uniref:Nucleotidyl transferase domain-containing protein n=1 Tax=Triparma strigata TaxID=1606541 RepID=A0A9W7AWI9_9STRA|nr:hypothetical protein TrST_g12459 [Triparma strigata]
MASLRPIDHLPPPPAANSHVPLNILIPMGGLGTRFSKVGYSTPKPLIKIAGRPMLFWLLDNLVLQDGDVVFMAIDRKVAEDFNFAGLLRDTYGNDLDFRVILLDFETRGAAETLYSMLQEMSAAELENRTISLDSDTVYFSDVLTDFRNLPPLTGASFYFKDLRADAASNPIFSYIKLTEPTKRIVEIKEKVMISDNANTGAYAFASAALLRSEVEGCIDGAVGAKGEYYTSAIIDTMLKRTDPPLPFVGVHVSDFVCVGTPKQLDDFLDELREGKRARTKRGGKMMTFSFNFDEVDGLPLLTDELREVRMMKDLKAVGYRIEIDTRRRDKVNDDTMKESGIPFDSFGDESARKDKIRVVHKRQGVNDIEREVGWKLRRTWEGREAIVERATVTSLKRGEGELPRGFNKPRRFNMLRIDEWNGTEVVVKTGPKEIISGEHFWYSTLPERLKCFTPFYFQDAKPLQRCEDNQDVVILSKMNGVTFSGLLRNKCVTKKRLKSLLIVLDKIHASPEKEEGADDAQKVCWNYVVKLQNRYRENRELYRDLSATSGATMSSLEKELDNYQESKSYSYASRIHGDPVFTNVILNHQGAITLVDPRGKVGPADDVSGDKWYDYSKVLQSLYGYDFFIGGVEKGDVPEAYLSSLRDCFWDFVKEKIGAGQSTAEVTRMLKLLTAAHYFSIVPLHDDPKHQSAFLAMAELLIKMI